MFAPLLLATLLSTSARGNAGFKVKLPTTYAEITDAHSEAAATVKAGGIWLIAHDADHPSQVLGTIIIAPSAADDGADAASAKYCGEVAALKAESAHSLLISSAIVQTPFGAACQIDLRQTQVARRMVVVPFSAGQLLTVSCFILAPARDAVGPPRFPACDVVVKSLERAAPEGAR